MVRPNRIRKPIVANKKPVPKISKPFQGLVVLAVDSLVMGYAEKGEWKEAGPEFSKNHPILTFSPFSVGTATKVARKAEISYEEVYQANYLSNVTDLASPLVSGTKPTVINSVKSLPLTSAVYKKICSDWLARNGLKGVKVDLRKLVRVDLDDDGTAEVILEARNRWGLESTFDSDAQPGDYSLVLLRSIKGGKVLETPLEFISKAKHGHVSQMRLRGIADIDQDGRMEIITDALGFEWHQPSLWKYDKGTAKRVIQLYAGQ